MIDRLKSLIFATLVAAGLLGGAPAWATPVLGEPDTQAPVSEAAVYPYTRPNPEAEIGHLANGLTYGVMRRAAH